MRQPGLSVRACFLGAVGVMAALALSLVVYSGHSYREAAQRDAQAGADARLAAAFNAELASTDAAFLALAKSFAAETASVTLPRDEARLRAVLDRLSAPLSSNGLRAVTYVDHAFGEIAPVTTGSEFLCRDNGLAGPASRGVKNTFCNTSGGLLRVATIPVSVSNGLSGYLKLVLDARPSMLALEQRLGQPLEVLSAEGSVWYRSPRWVALSGAIAEHRFSSLGGMDSLRLRAADPGLLISDAAGKTDTYLMTVSLAVIAFIAALLFGLFNVVMQKPLQRLRRFLQHVSERGPTPEKAPNVGGARELRDLALRVKDLVREYNRLFESLASSALTDSVTGLANRTRFLDLLHRAIDTAQRDFKPFALLLMDLDQFKEINDSLGHHVGDVLLREVGNRLKKRLRDTDAVARLGGDEFALLLPDVNEKDALIAARMLIQALRAPISLEGQVLDIGASVGIVIYPDHGVDAGTLIKRAEVAMYHAKDKNRGYVFYEDGMDPHSPTRLLMLGQLRHALDKDEFALLFQPKVSLRDNVASGVEALVRWKHPSGNLYLPDTFIPLLESNGLIRNLTEWVLREAFVQCRRLQEAGHQLRVSLNLSVRDLQDAHFVDVVAEQLAANRIEPQSIVLEITESAVMTDPEHAIRVLHRLSSMGFTLAIDDFGTGYSSLAYLKKLPVGEFKIDKTFVINMARDPNDAAIVRTSIELARNLGLSVVAEGVESEEILTRLRQLGCDAAQGMYISRPLSIAELDEWLAKSVWARQTDKDSPAAVRGPRRWH